MAEDDHGIEERRCDGLADDGNADRVDEQTCFDAARFSDSATRMIAGVMIPFGKRSEGIGRFGKKIRNFRVFPEFILGGLLIAEIVRKKRA